MSADERRSEERHNHDPFAELLHEVGLIRRLMVGAGRPFSTPDGANCDGTGLGVVAFRGPSNGQLWLLESIGVSVTGASAAAVVAAYLNANDEGSLLPGFFLNALNGNAPSRGFMAPARAAYVWSGMQVLVVVRGAAAAAQVQARIQGRVKELAEVQGGSGIATLPAPPVTSGQV